MKRLVGRSRLRIEWWAILLVTSLVVAIFPADRTLLRFDNLIYDHLIRLAPPASSDRIMIVAIDEDSLRRIGRWPWPREIHARLIRAMTESEPRAIAYDVLFTERSSRAGDEALGKAMAESGQIFVPLSFVEPGRNGAPFEALLPIAPVRRAAAGIGHVNLIFDADGLVRRAALTFGDRGSQWPHLMQELGTQAGLPQPEPFSKAKLIPFSGVAGHWPTVSAAAVLNGEVPPAFLRGRILLVGATAQALGDRHQVAAGGQMPGVEIQAHLLNGLLMNRLVSEASLPTVICFGLVPLWLLLLLYRVLHSSASVACALGMSVLILLSTAAAFALLQIWIPPAAALAGVLVSYPLWAWRQLASADAFMRAELKRFRAEPTVLPLREQPGKSGDRFESTIRLLRQAIANARELRHFIADRLHQLPDPTLVADLEGTVVLANAAAANLFDSLGIPSEDRVNLAFLSSFQLSVTGEKLAMRRDDDGSLACEQADAEVSTGDGRFFVIRFAPQTSAEGELVGWIVRILDVSEAKAVQRQKDDIVQLLTHDMRSPQASIIAVLETATGEQIDEKVATRIRHYARRTLGLADGFVQLARAESLTYSMEEIDLADMLVDAIDDLWPQITAKNMHVEICGEEEGLIVQGERSLLTRALSNVLGNAVKYSGPNTRIICTLARQISDKGCPIATCAISDEGPGFLPEHQNTIFERFKRGPLGIGHKVEGVGLGLSFVHTVMVRHKGDIRCASEPGRGSTFTFMLPLIPEALPISADEKAPIG